MGSYQIRYHAFTGALSSLTGSFPLYCPYVLTPASTWVILRGWCVVLGHPNQSRFMLHILRAALNKANPPGWYNSDPILFRMAAFSICKSDLRFKMLDGERTIMDKIISWMHYVVVEGEKLHVGQKIEKSADFVQYIPSIQILAHLPCIIH